MLISPHPLSLKIIVFNNFCFTNTFLIPPVSRIYIASFVYCTGRIVFLFYYLRVLSVLLFIKFPNLSTSFKGGLTIFICCIVFNLSNLHLGYLLKFLTVKLYVKVACNIILKLCTYHKMELVFPFTCLCSWITGIKLIFYYVLSTHHKHNSLLPGAPALLTHLCNTINYLTSACDS